MKTVEEGAKPSDFRRPGHMFPLEAREGGVLKQAESHHDQLDA